MEGRKFSQGSVIEKVKSTALPATSEEIKNEMLARREAVKKILGEPQEVFRFGATYSETTRMYEIRHRQLQEMFDIAKKHREIGEEATEKCIPTIPVRSHFQSETPIPASTERVQPLPHTRVHARRRAKSERAEPPSPRPLESSAPIVKRGSLSTGLVVQPPPPRAKWEPLSKMALAEMCDQV